MAVGAIGSYDEQLFDYTSTTVEAGVSPDS